MHGGTLGIWGLLQIGVDIFLGLGVLLMTMRLSRAPKDDPRLSRGLQLLQSKIAVLEDLSDRTETQVHQLTTMLDQKCRDVQNKIQAADRQVHALRSSMERSMEVAQIFQDKIPHQEIIERQNTIKYVQAARLAHQGRSVDEISSAIDLPKGEIEFIAKVNREHLLFSEDSLPPWAQQTQGPEQISQPSAQANYPAPPPIQETHFYEPAQPPGQEFFPQSAQQMYEEQMATEHNLSAMPGLDIFSSATQDFKANFDLPKTPASLEQLGEEFRKLNAMQAAPAPAAPSPALEEARQMAMTMARTTQTPVPAANNPILNRSQRMTQARGKNQTGEPVIRKVEFRRIKDDEHY